MALLLPLTAASLQGFVTWLKVLLRHASGRLKACLRFVLFVACNVSTRFRMVEGGDGQRRASASICVPSSSILLPAESNPFTIDPGNLAIPLLKDQPVSSAHGQGSDNVAADTYTPSFPEPAEVQDGNHPPHTANTKLPKLKPILASFIQGERYDRESQVLEPPSNYLAPAGIPDFSEKMYDPAWQSLVHPEGALFFYEPHKRIVTEADIRQSDNAKKIKGAFDAVQRLVKDKNIYIPGTAELVLGIDKSDNTYGYYYVDHGSKSLFWAEDHKLYLSETLENVPVKEKSHIKYAYEYEYWTHCDLFPNKRVVQQDAVDRLKCIIIHAYAETITSEASLAPYNTNDLNAMMALIGPLNESAGKAHEHSMCIIARLMQTFTCTQFINFCGQPAARLDVDKPLYYQRDEILGWKAFLPRLLNIALFGSLQSHRKSIERVWVDNSVVVTRWKNFIDGLSTEWSSFTVFSTVMLAVDVSFLAVPGIDANSVQWQSAPQILAYLSTLCAMGSLIVSLILASQIQIPNRDNAEAAGPLLLGMSQSLLGLDGLALIHSLPFALLIWAMIFFAAGLSVIIFYSTDAIALGVVGPVWAVIMLLTGWTVLAINNIHISSLFSDLADTIRVARTRRRQEARTFLP